MVPAVSAHVMTPSCPQWVWKQVLLVLPSAALSLLLVHISTLSPFLVCRVTCPPPLTVCVYLDFHCATSSPSTGPDGRCTTVGGWSFEHFSLGLSFLHVRFIFFPGFSFLESPSVFSLLPSPLCSLLHEAALVYPESPRMLCTLREAHGVMVSVPRKLQITLGASYRKIHKAQYCSWPTV